MFNWVGLLLRAGYYIGHAIGVSNFEVDWRTGRVFTSTRSTLYAVASNVIIGILIGLKFIEEGKYTISLRGANKIYRCVLILVTTQRITAGLVILLNQWHKQSQLMIVARNAIKLCLARPQIMRIIRWRILFKFMNSLLAVVFPLLFALFTIGLGNTMVFPGLVLHLWMTAILNMVISQYFLVMACVRAHYVLLNTELQQVIEESRKLSSSLSPKAAFVTKCCALADQLDDIAKIQSQLLSIVHQSGAVFAVPKLVMFCYYYVSSVVTTYTSYNVIKIVRRNPGEKLRDIIVSFTWGCFFHMDAMHNAFMAFHVQDGHQEMIRLLDERSLFASGLDARLEETFANLQLQLIRNPLKLDVLQLFPINRKSTWAMLTSILSHSICLVQYDMENLA